MPNSRSYTVEIAVSVPPNSAAIMTMPGKTKAWYGMPRSSRVMAP